VLINNVASFGENIRRNFGYKQMISFCFN